MKIRLFVMALAISSACPVMANVIASSGFDSGTEGWGLAGDGTGLNWQSTGGNPGGYINARDQSKGSMWLFSAPPAYTGNQGAAYGGTISYSLRVSGNNNWNPNGGDVFLVGDGGKRLAADSGTPPNTSWGQYSVVLDASGGWRFNSLTGAVATEQEIMAVLSDLTAVEIRGEYFAGGDNADLDSVSMEQINPGTARFPVTKTFSDGSTDDVDVTLTCTTGLPLTQSATITGGDPTGVTFVVTDIDGPVDCEVTETGSPAGYTPVFNGGAGCAWNNVVDTLNTCVISNAARPGTFTANMEWNVQNEGGDEVNETAAVTITCDSAIVGGTQSGSYWSLTSVLGDGDSLTATVDTTTGTASCWANQTVTASGVESTDDCSARPITAGGSSSCTFVNTVFFEGVPTLSQYGMALMALLMLGVGFIGIMRFA